MGRFRVAFRAADYRKRNNSKIAVGFHPQHEKGKAFALIWGGRWGRRLPPDPRWDEIAQALAVLLCTASLESGKGPASKVEGSRVASGSGNGSGQGPQPRAESSRMKGLSQGFGAQR